MQAVPREPSSDVAADESWQTIGILDGEGRFLFASSWAGSALGLEPAELAGAAFPELVLASDRMRVLMALAELGGYPSPTRMRVGLCDRAEPRQLLDCRLSRMYGASGERTALLEVRMGRGTLSAQPAAVRAAAEQVAQDAQAALLRKTAELEAILRALPDLFFRFDAEGRFLDFSAPAGSMLYAPPSLFLGKRPHDVMPPELADNMERVRLETHASGALVTLEYAIEIDGKTQHCEARYVPHLDGQTIALVRDVSERVDAESALRASERRLRESQKLDAVGRLAGGVAHDFNNLLMIILGYTSAVARHIAPKHPAAAALEEIGRAVDRATALTKQLLALSRRQPVQPTVLDLGTVLTDMGSMLARVIGEHITFSLDVAPGLAHLSADRSQIEQIVLNLVLNARDAMQKGGRLSIRAENGRPADAADSPAREGRHVTLTVCDTGEGMDVDTQARIFEPFFTTKARGTGLGLFTVHHIVDEYGGTISVSSQPGVGTRFIIELPAVSRTAERVHATRTEPVAGGEETVLVVEDEEPVRSLLVDVLQQLGYTVLAASNAHEALALAAEHRAAIDLLLTDVVMPGGSGWELAAQVVEQRPTCRVLYMSGHAIGADESKHSRVVQGDLLHKPFTPSALAARVRELLGTTVSRES